MRRWAALAVALALALAGAGAAGSPAEAEIASGRVRIVQTVANIPAVDILLNSNRTFCSLPFKAVTRYAVIPVGTYNLQAAPTTGSPQANTVLKVEPNAPYSVVLVGTQAGVDTLTLIDDLGAPPAGMSKVRFVNAAPGAPAVDIAIKGGPLLFRDVGYKGVGNYVMMTAGTYDVQVRLSATGEVVAELPEVQAVEGVVYTVYAVGTPSGDPPAQALVAVESAGGLPVPVQP